MCTYILTPVGRGGGAVTMRGVDLGVGGDAVTMRGVDLGVGIAYEFCIAGDGVRWWLL